MFRLARHWKKLTGSVAVSAALGGAVFLTTASNKEDPEKNRQLRIKETQVKIPSREEHLAKLKSKTLFDVLVIGGGATGTGIALDCATRGINVALVEREDFASGTSSRSTKLIHGGVRYLEAAIKNLDYSQVHLVFEALHERTTFLNIAPHLTRKLPLLTPCYKWYEIPYMYTGLAMYDLLSGKGKLGNTAIISKAKSLEKFPQLAGENLKGTILYYDGQMNDSRMNVALATTAAVKGASLANYVEVVELLKDKAEPNKLIGAKVKDNLTGEEWDIHAKIIVNATGPYVDHIRLMNDPSAHKMIKPSNGTHIIIPQKFATKDAGILIPKTKDGRVLFLLPWENRVLAGTTDSEAELLDHPVPQQKEVDFILEELNRVLVEPVTQQDVLSVWSGIRPLAKPLKVKDDQDTKAISRDHVVEVSDNGLLTITGGKWTTYRKMAQDITDRISDREEMKQKSKFCISKADPDLTNFRIQIKCFTDEVPLVGALGYNSVDVQEELKRQYHRYNKAEKKHHPIDDDIAEHLAHSYGSRAGLIGELAAQGYGQRLAPDFPFLEAEVVYCATNEYAATAVDLLARRTRLAFLDTNAARKALPRVIDLMATTLKWDAKRKQKEENNALKFLETMHVNNNTNSTQK